MAMVERVLVIVVMASFLPITQAQTYTVERVADGLDHPVYVCQAPGDDQSLYIVEQRSGTGTTKESRGVIKKLDLPSGVMTDWLILDNIPANNNDGGVHSICFHPDFQSNGRFFVIAVTANPTAEPVAFASELWEYQVNSDTGLPEFVRTVLVVPQTAPGNAVHAMNWCGFLPGAQGTDKSYLYISQADGGLQADAPTFVNVSQDLSTLYGKILRVDIDGLDAYPGDPFRNYALVATNPYFEDVDSNNVDDDPNTAAEIWLSGFRNPWRVSFDRLNGDFYLGDVGFQRAEEINFYRSDWPTQDYGWSNREGIASQDNVGGPKGNSLDPILELLHTTGNRSLIGGYVYRGPILELQGKYIFGDFVTNNIWTSDYDRDTDRTAFDGTQLTNLVQLRQTWESLVPGGATINRVVSFGEDNAGNVYVVDFGSGNIFNPTFDTGEVFRLMPRDETIPFFTQQPVNVSVTPGEPASFTALAEATVDPNITYQWFKRENSTDVSVSQPATQAQGGHVLDFPAVVIEDNGLYFCRATNSGGSSDSDLARLHVRRGLVHRWSFTNDPNDSIGTAHLTLNGGATISGGLLDLPGGSTRTNNASATDDALVELAGTINGSDSITIIAWFTQDVTQSWSKIFMAGQGAGSEFMDMTAVRPNADGVPGMTFNNGVGGESVVVVPAGNALTNSLEYFMAAIWDEAAGTLTCYLAQAGRGDASNLVSGSTAVDFSSGGLEAITLNEFYLGSAVQFPDPDFNGLINEVRIYDEALSLALIQAHYLAGPDDISAVVCLDRPTMDGNDDCVVDFEDFVLLYAQWLLCGLSECN